MHLFRVVLTWAGPQVVGNSVTVLHYDGSNQSAPPVASILAAFDPLKPVLPTALTVTVPNTGDIIDDVDGSLQGIWSASGGGTKGMTGTAPCAAGVGACIGWQTGGIVNGTKGPRKLRGRTFIVPMSSDSYDAQGTLSTVAQTQLESFASQLQAAGPMGIWHRPSSLAARNGSSSSVLSHRIRDKVAYLSSRRD